MDQRATAEARHRTYALLGRLVLQGLDADAREVVAALPALDAAIETEDLEAWAVDHQRVWGFEIFPYESVFLGAEGLLGGEHLGAELMHLAHLCAAERDARVDGEDAVAARMLGIQRDFLSQHLLRWLPPVLAAVDADGTRFDRAVAELVAELVADHGSKIRSALRPPEGEPLDVDALLSDRKTGVRRIAQVLLRPAATGWFLSAGAIGRLAAAAGVPEGFGPRVKKLESVVFAAVDHDALPALVEALQTELERWRMRYLGLEGLGLPVGSWVARLDRTADLVARLEAAAQPDARAAG